LKILKIVGAFVIVAGSFFATLWAMNYVWPGCPSGKVNALVRPFTKNSGFSYVKDLGGLNLQGDSPDNPTRSNLLVCESNTLLGPMHVTHGDIAKLGEGRYSHWNNSVVFSASDNSDPNTNGRIYTIITPPAGGPAR
jgi:hypothetical protein